METKLEKRALELWNDAGLMRSEAQRLAAKHGWDLLAKLSESMAEAARTMVALERSMN